MRAWEGQRCYARVESRDTRETNEIYGPAASAVPPLHGCITARYTFKWLRDSDDAGAFDMNISPCEFGSGAT
jgi:hypothetical protein